MKGIRVFYLNDVCYFRRIINNPDTLLKRAILGAAIFAPLQSVIQGQKPHGFRKAL